MAKSRMTLSPMKVSVRPRRHLRRAGSSRKWSSQLVGVKMREDHCTSTRPTCRAKEQGGMRDDNHSEAELNLSDYRATYAIYKRMDGRSV